MHVLINFSRHVDEKSNAGRPVHSNTLLILNLDYIAVSAEGFRKGAKTRSNTARCYFEKAPGQIDTTQN